MKGGTEISGKRDYRFWGRKVEELFSGSDVLAGFLGDCMVGILFLKRFLPSGGRCNLGTGITIQTCPSIIN